MRKNYHFTISYDGSRYYGWEHQPGIELTVQGKIESVLKEMTGQDVEVISSGRTDAGVHALGQSAHAHMETTMGLEEILEYMNHYLPDDICILSAAEVADRFHARYNAVRKTYRYTCYIGRLKPVFDRKYCITLDTVPDLSAMEAAAADLIGEHDFASFCGNVRMKKSTVRRIESIQIHMDGDYLTFTYTGNGFLQYMVRILTGTLLEVGLGKRPADSMPQLLAAKKRSEAGYTVPAKGLALVSVEYK